MKARFSTLFVYQVDLAKRLLMRFILRFSNAVFFCDFALESNIKLKSKADKMHQKHGSKMQLNE